METLDPRSPPLTQYLLGLLLASTNRRTRTKASVLSAKAGLPAVITGWVVGIATALARHLVEAPAIALPEYTVSTTGADIVARNNLRRPLADFVVDSGKRFMGAPGVACEPHIQPHYPAIPPLAAPPEVGGMRDICTPYDSATH